MLLRLYFCLLFVCLLNRGADTQDPATEELARTLLSLVTEERQLRSKLEAEADLLEQELNQLQAFGQNGTCGCTMSYAPIAFSTLLTKDITHLGTAQTIPFDDVVTNVGNGYDVRHAEFTAPVAGTYEFTVAAMTNGGHYLEVEIVKNGVSMAKTRSGDSSYYTMGTAVVVLHLNAGDDVWVRHGPLGDSNIIIGHSFSSFSGYLIEA